MQIKMGSYAWNKRCNWKCIFWKLLARKYKLTSKSTTYQVSQQVLDRNLAKNRFRKNSWKFVYILATLVCLIAVLARNLYLARFPWHTLLLGTYTFFGNLQKAEARKFFLTNETFLENVMFILAIFRIF